ncbi:MAG: ATP-binding protein, partial [Thermoleophilaceae bacterium]
MVNGRAEELTELERRLDRRVASVLVGEAGIGKTALLRAAADTSGAEVFEGGGLAMLSEIPYVPLTRALGEEPPEGDEGGVGAFVAERIGPDGLLLLDDLQWADAATLAATPFIADRVRVIAAVRRGDPATPPVLAGLVEGGFEPLDVDPLDPDAAAKLLRAVRPGLGAGEVGRLVELAHGNPLLLLELGAGGEISETLEI